MNDNQVFNKLVAFLGNKAEGIIEAAKSNLKNTYGIVDGEKHHEKTWLEVIAKSAFIQALFAGLLACIFISAWRIVSTVVSGEQFYFILLAFATVIAETVNEAVMVFRFALTDEKHAAKNMTKWETFFHYVSLMGVARIISRFLFGRELPVLQYLLVYLIAVGIGFNLDYVMGLTGFADKAFHVLYAMLPIVGIGILSHYLGVNLREEKEKLLRSNVDFDKAWQAEKLAFLLDTLESKASAGVGYCAKALEYYYALTSSENSAISSGSVPVLPNEQAGFARLATLNNLKSSEPMAQKETFRTSDLELARRVIETYPDVLIDDRGWHGRISEVTGLSRGTPTTRIYQAMQYISNQNETNNS